MGKLRVLGLAMFAYGAIMLLLLYSPQKEWALEHSIAEVVSTTDRRVGNRVALQGNLDPSALHGTPDIIRSEAARIIDGYGNHPGHVFNLGHGISQFTNPDNVSILVEAVHSRSRAIRAAGEN